MKKTNKGFTLIELMIVVAIIGILAAVAVPGFMRYIKDSKTAEAKDNLKAIGDGALAYFEAEHVYDANAMKPQSRLYPGQNELGTTYVASGTKTIGDITVVGQKNDPTLAATLTALKAAPWNHLKFQINKPYYYQYTYSSAGNTAGTSVFGASAGASLNEANDSGFILNGTAQGKLGNILECAEGQTKVSSNGGSATCTAGGGSGS